MSIRAEYLAQKVAELSVLPRFPYDQDARLMILRTLSEMVKDEEALDWLIRRAVNLWNKWEGIRELRAIYCSRYYPGDGIETTSAIYTDGVPPDPALPRLALPAGKFEGWPKEELEAIGKAWAARNKFSPAEKRRQEMRAWIDVEHLDLLALESKHDDAMIGVAVMASNRKACFAVYDYASLVEGLEDRENMSPDEAAEAVAQLSEEVLLFYRPPGGARPRAFAAPITQEQINQALTVARAKRDGWTPERLAEVEAEVRRREKQEPDF
jgi:hypothetical protein